MPNWAEYLSRQNEMIAVTLANVSCAIRKRSHDIETEPADPARWSRLIERARDLHQRIERSAVIVELDQQLTGLKSEGDLDPARRGQAVIPVLDGVGEQLLENDRQPRPFERRQGMPAGEPLGPGDEAKEFGRIVAQDQRCSSPPSTHRHPRHIDRPRAAKTGGSSALASVGAREAN